MAGGRRRSTDPREESIEELEWLRLTLTTVGGLYGELLETQSFNTYEFLDGVLSAGSTPTDWIQSGVATWIEGWRASAGLVRGLGSTLSRSLGPSSPQTGVYGDQIEFYVDKLTQATDPVPTDIPLDQINAISVKTNDSIPESCVNLTRSKDDKVCVALWDLDVSAPTLESGKSYVVELVWGGGLTPLTVHVE